MANVVIGSPALSDAAVMTDPNGANTNPGALQTLQLADRWGRGTNPAVEMFFAAPIDPTLFFLGGHNGSASGTYRLRGAVSQAALLSGPAVDISASLWPVTGKPSGWDLLPTVRFDAGGFGGGPLPWWRLDIDDASAPSGQFRAGRLYLGDVTTVWQPSINMSKGLSIGFIDRGTVKKTRSGNTWPGRAVGRPRVLDFKLGAGTRDEMLTYDFELQRLRGILGDIVVIMDPAATTHLHRGTIYGLRQSLAPIVLPQYNIYESQFQVEELMF